MPLTEFIFPLDNPDNTEIASDNILIPDFHNRIQCIISIIA